MTYADATRGNFSQQELRGIWKCHRRRNPGYLDERTVSAPHRPERPAGHPSGGAGLELLLKEQP